MIQSLNRTGTWQTYSMADGPAGLHIEHIAEDSEGCLWFATRDNGVSRFDGDMFESFTRQDGLIHDSVYFVSKDSRDRLWFGTLNGVCWYDGSDFHHIRTVMGSASLPLPMVCPIRQSELCSRIASISSGSLPGTA